MQWAGARMPEIGEEQRKQATVIVCDIVCDNTNSSGLFEDTCIFKRYSYPNSLQIYTVYTHTFISVLSLSCFSFFSFHSLPSVKLFDAFVSFSVLFYIQSTNVFEFVSILFDAFSFHSVKHQISTVLTSMIFFFCVCTAQSLNTMASCTELSTGYSAYSLV